MRWLVVLVVTGMRFGEAQRRVIGDNQEQRISQVIVSYTILPNTGLNHTIPFYFDIICRITIAIKMITNKMTVKI